MAIKELEPLKIEEIVGDRLEVLLTESRFPSAYQRKKYELIHKSGMTEDEACRYLATTPLALEIFYDADRGLFAVEEEACECCEIFNPYTGREIPNDNLPPKEEKSPEWQLSEITCQLEEISSELRRIWETDSFSPTDEERIENANYSVDDALAILHCIGDAEDED